MPSDRIRAVFMRGGTSKAVMFRREDLPADRGDWDAIFLAVIGAPDPNGRQLDGMGGGVSSVSKVCVIGPPSRPDADVDYTFAQIGVRDSLVDYAGNCGNMSSAIGPFALDEGLVAAGSGPEAVVRIHNTNTGKIIAARFPIVDGRLAADGDMEIDGVAGTAAPIRLEFLAPGGARTGQLLPTGQAQDRLTLPDGREMRATCVDAANPCVFVAADDLGLDGTELPTALEKDAAGLATLEAIRCAASVAMGITPTLDDAAKTASIPKVAIVRGPCAGPTLSGRSLSEADADVWVRMISVGQPHRAVPITGAICLAVAVRIPGSIPALAAGATDGPLRIAHPSGTTVVDASVEAGPDGCLVARHGAVYRTARLLFDGHVHYRRPAG